MDLPKAIEFDTLTIHNDQISYVKAWVIPSLSLFGHCPPPTHGPGRLPPPPPLAPGPRDLRSRKQPKPDLPADQGRVVSAQPGGGDADPFSPPPTARDNSGPALTRPRHYLCRGAPPPPPLFPPQSNPHRWRLSLRHRSPIFFAASRRPRVAAPRRGDYHRHGVAGFHSQRPPSPQRT